MSSFLFPFLAAFFVKHGLEFSNSLFGLNGAELLLGSANRVNSDFCDLNSEKRDICDKLP